MADRVRFIPNNKGIQQWMIDNLSDAITEHGEAMAASIAEEYDVPAEFALYITDRPHGSLIVPRGQLLQAKYGAITKAAAERGLEVSDS